MIKLFENYNEIAEICKKYKIDNWTLNPDGSIDVVGDVEFSDMATRDAKAGRLSKLPLKFGRVGGDFYCGYNKLTTLGGCPREVGGNFYCHNNKLTTLIGSPGKVSGNFYCDNNNLNTLEGAPREVGSGFICNNNKLITLAGAPNSVLSYFDCQHNNLTSLEGAPREVGGNFYMQKNSLPEYFNRFMRLNNWSQPIIKQILKWQDEYELWKNPQIFKEKFKRMMVDIQENDLPDIKIIFPEDD